jgi:hypothetical protein
VDSKFDRLWGGWCSFEPAGAFGVRLWKNIKKGWETFLRFFRFEVGDGARTKFCHNLWCGDTVLKDAFPVLFGIAHANDASVANNFELFGGSNQWSGAFLERRMIRKLMSLLLFFKFCT